MTKLLPLLALVAPLNAQTPFSNLYAFGDSLTDTGNAFIASFGTIPSSPYYNGRFSNGPNWFDCFAADLGFSSNAAFAGGNNYAFGGAEAGDGTFGSEISTYLSGVSGTADSNALYVAWIGGNDINQAAGNAGSSATIASALSTLEDDLFDLADAGVTRMLIPNLPDIGLVPGQLGSASAADASALTLQWNNTLANTIIPNLQAADVVVFTPDIYSEFNSIVANPAAFGFTDSTSEAFLDPGVIAGTTSANDFVFVDGLHPSEAAHNLICETMLASIPEPSSTVLLAISLSLLTRRKRA